MEKPDVCKDYTPGYFPTSGMIWLPGPGCETPPGPGSQTLHSCSCALCPRPVAKAVRAEGTSTSTMIAALTARSAHAITVSLGEPVFTMPPTPSSRPLSAETSMESTLPQRVSCQRPHAATKPSAPNTALPYTTIAGAGAGPAERSRGQTGPRGLPGSAG
jgi:hypothetical protein